MGAASPHRSRRPRAASTHAPPPARVAHDSRRPGRNFVSTGTSLRKCRTRRQLLAGTLVAVVNGQAGTAKPTTRKGQGHEGGDGARGGGGGGGHGWDRGLLERGRVPGGAGGGGVLGDERLDRGVAGPAPAPPLRPSTEPPPLFSPTAGLAAPKTSFTPSGPPSIVVPLGVVPLGPRGRRQGRCPD